MVNVRTILAVAAASVCLASVANAAVYTMDFSGGGQGSSTSITYMGGEPFDNLNVSPDFKIAAAGNSSKLRVALFHIPSLPADLAGATVTSATFSVKADYGGQTGTIVNTELHRIDTPAAWQPGNGTWGAFWDRDNGANFNHANRNDSNGTGVDWGGNPWGWSQLTDPNDFRVAMKDLIGSAATLQGSDTSPVTFDVTMLVQKWADGLDGKAGGWDDDGFALFAPDATSTSTAILDMTTAGGGLTINYTPVPEPTTLSLLVLGGLATLRRRRA